MNQPWAHAILITPVAAYATVHCSNSTCAHTLPISLEDAADGTVPKVEGWRTEVRDGETYAFCGSCAEHYLPTEESIIYERLR